MNAVLLLTTTTTECDHAPTRLRCRCRCCRRLCRSGCITLRRVHLLLPTYRHSLPQIRLLSNLHTHRPAALCSYGAFPASVFVSYYVPLLRTAVYKERKRRKLRFSRLNRRKPHDIQLGMKKSAHQQRSRWRQMQGSKIRGSMSHIRRTAQTSAQSLQH